MSEYYLTNKELYHYGIKGQRWGTRRWQNDDGSFNEEGKIRYGRVSDGKKKPGRYDKYSKDAQYYIKKGNMTIAAASVLGTAAAAYGAYSIYKHWGESWYMSSMLSNDLYTVLTGGYGVYSAIRNLKSRKADEKLLENSEFKSVKDIPKSKTDYNKNYFTSKDGKAGSEELRKGVNPDYPKTGSNRNCMLCTTAMAMRLKGYDVQANKINQGFESYKPEDWFSNSQVKRINRKSKIVDVINELSSQGDGSYGNIMVSWKKTLGGGGHSILYTVKHGKVEFIDGQANTTYDADQLFKWVDMNDVSYINLTNAVPKDIVAGLVKSNK